MKKALLFTFLICFLAVAVQAQSDCDGCASDEQQYDTKPATVQVQKHSKRKKISVFPNPAVNFIGLSDAEDVKKIVILNVMGRETKKFVDVEKGMKYNVSDLKRGMYLVQIYDQKNKIITTQRLNKQ